MTKTPYSPHEIERVKDALLGAQRSAKCPKHDLPLKVVETLAWRDEGRTVKERMFNSLAMRRRTASHQAPSAAPRPCARSYGARSLSAIR